MSGEPGVLAVDGGNSKTDLALLDATGRLLALVRGRGSSPHHLGIDGCIEVLGSLLERAAAHAGLAVGEHPLATTAHILLAGADTEDERAILQETIERQGWSERLVVDTDTVALLRAGTDRGWGVVVVCGHGINCLGVAPDGRDARFLSFGPISGDWGGGGDVGRAALAAAARSADGRGPRTALEPAVAAHFGMTSPLDVSRAIHLEQLAPGRLGELATVVLALADEDPVAGGIVRRVADEVIAFARAALSRLEMAALDPDVVLGGRLLLAIWPRLGESITRGIAELAPGAHVVISPSEPIVGAALLGLDGLGADATAHARARAELDVAAGQVGVTLVSPSGLSGS